MIKVKELTDDQKRLYNNMEFQITLNGRKQYFTKKAFIELRDKMNAIIIKP